MAHNMDVTTRGGYRKARQSMMNDPKYPELQQPVTAEEESQIHHDDILGECVETWHKALTESDRQPFHARSISDVMIDNNQIGFCRPGAVTEEKLIELGLMKKGETCPFYGKYILPGFLNGVLVYLTAGTPVTADHWNYLKPPSPHIQQHVIGDIGDGSDPVTGIEGYFDMLSAMQEGFPCVCTLGASPTKEQKKELSKIQNLVVCFDNDESGRKASENLAQELFPSAKIADVSALGDCKDLNELLCSVGPERFREIVNSLVKNAQDPLEISLKRLETLISGGGERDAALIVFSDIMPMIVKLPSGLREYEMQALSKKTKPLGITLGNLREYLKCEQQREKLTQEISEQPQEKTDPLALFPSLVDIVAVETMLEKDGEMIAETKSAFLIRTEAGELITAMTHKVNGKAVSPPELDQIPWLLPREPEVRRYFDADDDKALCEDMLTFFKSNSDLPNENYYILELAWVIHTYFLEQIQYSPYLHHYAVWERGKSRTLKGMIWMANRGLLVESLNPAYIVRMAAYWKAALAIDVLELWKKAENSEAVDILMNRFEAGGKVPRVMYPDRGKLKDIVYFEIFGPTLIATNVPVGEGLATRAIQINMPESPREFKTKVIEADLLPFKERLTAMRTRHLYDQLPECEKPAFSRLGDITWPLLQVLNLICPRYIPYFDALVAELEAARCKASSMSIEAEIVEAIVSIKTNNETVSYDGIEGIVLNDIAMIINNGKGEKEKLSNKSIGNKLRAMGIHPYRKEPGTKRALYYYAVDIIELLMRRYGLKEKTFISTPPTSSQEDSQSSQSFQPTATVKKEFGSFVGASENPPKEFGSFGQPSLEKPGSIKQPSQEAPKNNPHGYEDWEHRELWEANQGALTPPKKINITDDLSDKVIDQCGPWPRLEV